MQSTKYQKDRLSNYTLTTAVSRQVEEKILAGELASGDKIIEEDLAHEIGVSRTPVKIALVELANEGIIEVIPRRGAFVKHFSREDLFKIHQVRAVLEGLAGRLAAPLFTRRDVEYLQENIESYVSLIPMSASPDSKERNRISMQMKHLDLDFHNYILDKTENEYLISTAQKKHLQFQCFMNTNWNLYDSAECNRVAREHQEIARALGQNQAERSETLLKKHIMIPEDE